jgi:catechol 2,3-dioxygenase-like lactoylglutathione lyase family enzyme
MSTGSSAMMAPSRTPGKEGSMGVFVGSIVLNVSDSDRAGGFWGQALGYVGHAENPEFLRPAEWRAPAANREDHGAAHLHLDLDDKTHLDLWVDGDSDLETEVERLVSLGATRVDWSYADDAEHVVLADPDGNLFCVCA